jgi:hypothetical protein
VVIVGGLAPPAWAQPRFVLFTCEIGDGRTRILVPRAEEEANDDELTCHAELAGSTPDASFAGELRLRDGGGHVRVVATGMFQRPDGDPRWHFDGQFVSHSTWSSAVSWRDPRHPRLQIELRAYRKRPEAPRRAWRQVASARLELGARGR